MKYPDGYFRRNLPHYHPNDAPYFVTFRLHGSITQIELARIEEKRSNPKSGDLHPSFFREYDAVLDRARRGPKFLARKDIQDIMHRSFAFIGERWLDLIAYCIMPNHVHFVAGLKGERSLSEVMHALKGFSAKEANAILGMTGKPFWQPESYDRVVRAGRLGTSVYYTINNPVKAGLVNHWSQWPGTYLSPDFHGIERLPPTLIV